jgi:hypothetical protein
MYHYRCQNVFITATASELIVNTLDFYPHHSHLPQMSSTDRVLMAAPDMTDALRYPHPDVPFATIGDDTPLFKMSTNGMGPENKTGLATVSCHV